MTDAFAIGTFDVSRKDSVAVLDDVAISLPEYKVFRTDGSVNDVGIPRPVAVPTASAGAAGNPNGAYIYKITYKDSVKGYFGQGSDTFSISVTNQQVVIDLTTLTNKAAHSAVDKIQIWRSAAGGSILFLVEEIAIASTSYTDNSSDATIGVNDTLPVAEQAYAVPTKDTFGFTVRAKDRVFDFGAADYYDDASEYRNKGAWSAVEPNAGIPFPEARPSENVVTFENGGEHLRSATVVGDFLAIFEESDIWMWVWIDNPDGQTGNGTLEPMGVGRGAVTFKAVVNVDGEVWVLDRQGVYRWEGGQSVTDVTETISREFNRINWSEVAQFHGTYDDKRVYWFVAMDGDTECRHVFVLDRKAAQSGRGIRWWLYFLPQGARDSTSYIAGASDTNEDFNMANIRVAQIITSEGYEQILKEGIYLDGVHPEITNAGVTASTADRVFSCTGADFDVGNATLAGAYVLFDDPRTPDPLVIESSSTNTFTLKNTLAFTLAAGTAFTIGYIKGIWRSGQLDTGGPETMKHYNQLAVVTNPMTEEGELRISTRNHRYGPFVSGVDESNRTGYRLDQYKPGAALKTGGRARGTGNRLGYAELPIIGRDGRYVSVEVEDNDCVPWELVGYYVQATPFPVDK